MTNVYSAPTNFSPDEFKAALVALFDTYTEPENSRLSEWSDEQKAQDAFNRLTLGASLTIGGQPYAVNRTVPVLSLTPIISYQNFVL